MRLMPLLMQLLIGMSMSRYLPATGTAGLARSWVRGNSRAPAAAEDQAEDGSRLHGIASRTRGCLRTMLPDQCGEGKTLSALAERITPPI